MPTIVTDSTQLRNTIQAIDSVDPIILDPVGTFSVLTLGKLSSFTPPPVPFTGYTIQGPGATLTDTRIYQNNIDSPYSPSVIQGDLGQPLTFFYNSGGAANGTAILRSTFGSYTLDNLIFTGSHRGWDGNSGLYMSIGTSNNGAPVTNPTNVDLTIQNSRIEVNGQGGFNPTVTNGGGSAFLHSFDNLGAVTLLDNTFDEAGFLSSFNFYNQNNTPSRGFYTIGGNTFTRSTNTSVVRRRGSRLTNVSAYLYDNNFNNGTFLDVFGNVDNITFDGSASQFTTIASGFGIRANWDAVQGNVTGSIKVAGTAILTFNSTLGLPIKYVNPNPNQVFTLDTLMDGGVIRITNPLINNFAFYQASAGGQNDDIITAITNPNGENTHIWAYGDAGNDNITGGPEENYLDGGVGNDTITSFSGQDTILGGDGNDLISSGGGDDRIFGSIGNDTIIAGLGNDVVIGGEGDDSIDAGSNDDTVDGGNGNNTVIGGTGADFIFTGSGNDIIDGGTGDDTIRGGAGNDSLMGEGNNDTINGEDGDDTLNGGIGADTLTGGTGVDLFVWQSGGGTDRITDFVTASEQVGIPNLFLNTTSGTTLNGSDYVQATSVSALTAANSNLLTEITTAQNTGQITTQTITGLTNAYVLAFNSTLPGGGRGALYFDADWGDTAGRTSIVIFNNFTMLADVTAVSNTNFLAMQI